MKIKLIGEDLEVTNPVGTEVVAAMPSFESLVEEIMKNDDARVAAETNRHCRIIAEVLRTGRIQRGMSIRELAKKLHTSNSHVQRILRNESNLSIKTLVRIAEALDLSLEITLTPQKEKTQL